MRHRPRWGPAALPYLLLFLTMCFWALNNVVSKVAVGQVPPAALVFWSWFIGLAVLTPFALPRVLARRDLVKRHWFKIVLIGTLGVSLSYHLFLNGLTFTTAINASLVLATVPVVIVALSWLLYRDVVTWRRAAGTAIALLGVVVIVVRGDLGVLVGLDVNIGDILTVGAVTAWALYSLFLRYMPEGLDPLAFLWIFALGGSALNGVVYVSELFAPMDFVLTWETAAMIGYASIFPNVIAFVFYNAGVRALGPAVAGQFNYLLPILSGSLAVGLLGEALEPYHMVGLVVILVGLYLATAPERARRRAAERSA